MAPARRPHPAAGGGGPGAEERGRLALLGAGGVGPLAVGQAGGGGRGARGEGLRVELHLLVSALLPRRERHSVGTDSISNFPFLRTRVCRSPIIPAAQPSHLPPLTPAHSLLGREGVGRGGAGRFPASGPPVCIPVFIFNFLKVFYFKSI